MALATNGPLVMRKITPAELDAYITTTLKGFNEGPWPQVKYYNKMMGINPGTRRWVTASFQHQQRTQPKSGFLGVFDTANADRLAGVSKWLAPGEEAYWADFDPDGMDVPMAEEFFGSMHEHHVELMGERPHWYLEVMAVDNDYQRRGIGKMMMQWGADQADRDGVESYVDGSPLGRGLYQQFGFVQKAVQGFAAPWEWMNLAYLVRPKKA